MPRERATARARAATRAALRPSVPAPPPSWRRRLPVTSCPAVRDGRPTDHGSHRQVALSPSCCSRPSDGPTDRPEKQQQQAQAAWCWLFSYFEYSRTRVPTGVRTHYEIYTAVHSLSTPVRSARRACTLVALQGAVHQTWRGRLSCGMADGEVGLTTKDGDGTRPREVRGLVEAVRKGVSTSHLDPRHSVCMFREPTPFSLLRPYCAAPGDNVVGAQ